ncbi:MAG: methyltransferase domain-containing protein [Chloroflexota bacterium]
MSNSAETKEHYDWLYQATASKLYQAIRAEAYDDDFGQAGWSTGKEVDKLIGRLRLKSQARVLDVGCGAGGVALRIAQRYGCQVVGIDSNQEAITQANDAAAAAGLAERTLFEVQDARQPLPFADASFDAIVCYDAITHFPDRLAVLRDWARLLTLKGKILYLDPLIISAPLSTEEIQARSGTGFNMFTPIGGNRRLLKQAGLRHIKTADRSKGLIKVAQGWVDACAKRADVLIELEGEDTFSQSQAFHQMAAKLAREKRLLRHLFIAERRQASKN